MPFGIELRKSHSLTMLSDRVYSGVEVDCNDVLSNVAPCFDTLEQRINATLQSVYNKTYVPAGNGRDSDYVYLAVRDEFCRYT